jgi:hypothetical protein
MRKIKGNIGLKILSAAIIALMVSPGCKQKPVANTNNFKNEIDSIGIVLVPDLREGIFDAELIPGRTGMILKGETSVPEAKTGIVNFLNQKGISFTDSLRVLPDTSEIKEPWGIVDVSVCNIRLFSSNEAEMVTQALMGTPVKILKKDNDWLLIQTPDLYIGWVDSDAIETRSAGEQEKWKSSSRLFYTAKTGDIYDDPSEDKVISDIVAGCIVERTGNLKNWFEVKLPDGRDGFIPASKAIPFEKLTVESYLKPGNLISTAKSFLGIPYLWGGTSAKGFDCSGFVKTIYYLNGIILSRDASQQFRHGTRIRLRRESFPDSLRAGDLLFFGSGGRGRPKPTHVGMYIGNTEFIHCSGMVKINSLDSTRSNFSRFRRDAFLGARRITGAKQDDGLIPVSGHNWYK